MNDLRFGVVALAVLLLASTGCGGGSGSGPGADDPIVVTLRNDSYENTDPVAFVTSFINGEAFGATLGPAPVVMTLDRILYRWGPQGQVGNYTLKVYQDTGAANPGTELVSIGRQLTSVSDPWQEFDVSSASILLGAGQSVRFVIEFQAALPVGPSRDGDGTNTAGKNWVFTAGSWIPSSSDGVTGDWIVRGIGVMQN